MSRSDNIPATSYWARKKVEFEADAEAGATSSLIRYELMTIAEAVDRPISIQQFSALIKVFEMMFPNSGLGTNCVYYGIPVCSNEKSTRTTINCFG